MSRGRPALVAFAVTAGLTFLLGATWAIATPLFAAPDEPSHAVRAVATWTGDPAGKVIRDGDGVRVKVYDVPSPYDRAQAIAVCSAFKVDQPADCGPAFDANGRTTSAASTAGFYPPLFYWLVGWGGALLDGSSGMYLMRMIHVVVCAALVGLAAVSTIRSGRGAVAMAGVALAVTPMVAFLSGTVNSSGLEIAASIALWCSLLALAAPSDSVGVRGRLPDAIVAVVSGLVLVFTRTISPGYAAVICGVALIATPGLGLRGLLRRRDLLAVLAVLGLGAAAATAMIIGSGQFDTAATSGWRLGPTDTPLSFGVGATERIVREMVGVFGWLDTGSPQLSYYVWTIACGTLVICAVIVGRWRPLVGIALTASATFVLPIAANWGQARDSGFVWQGRYSLPLAVGIPILAALTFDQGRFDPKVHQRLVTVLGVLVAAGHTYAVYWALRRFSVGLHGDLVFFGHGIWAPPLIGTTGTMVSASVASAGIAAALISFARRTSPPNPSASSPAADDDDDIIHASTPTSGTSPT